jgi:hypothetical protein
VDTGSSSYQVGELAGAAGTWAIGAGAAGQMANGPAFARLLRSSPLFGTRGMLNSNQWLRLGVGRYGGMSVFRLGGSLLGRPPLSWLPGVKDRHWIWFTFGPL